MARARAWTGELRKHVEERERATNVRRARSQENRTNEQRQADKARKRQTRKRRTESELPGPFVAVDAEGVDIGEPFEVIPGDPKLDFGLAYDPASADAKLMAQDHATFLWAPAMPLIEGCGWARPINERSTELKFSNG